MRSRSLYTTPALLLLVALFLAHATHAAARVVPAGGHHQRYLRPDEAPPGVAHFCSTFLSSKDAIDDLADGKLVPADGDSVEEAAKKAKAEFKALHAAVAVAADVGAAVDDEANGEGEEIGKNRLSGGVSLASSPQELRKERLSGLQRLCCAKRFKLEVASGGEALSPCLPIDFDFAGGPVPGPGHTFWKDSFAQGNEQQFLREFSAAKDAGCYRLAKIPGFGQNFAVLVGFGPTMKVKKDGTKEPMSFYSVQGDICHAWLALRQRGFPRRNIVVVSYDEAIRANADGGISYKVDASKMAVGAKLKCGGVLDYVGHYLFEDTIPVAEKWKDMLANDLVTVPIVLAILRGDAAFTTGKCAARTDTRFARCTGRVVQTSKHDKVLLHLNGHGGSEEMLMTTFNAMSFGDAHYPEEHRDMSMTAKAKYSEPLGDRMWVSTTSAKGKSESSVLGGLVSSVVKAAASRALHTPVCAYLKESKAKGRHGLMAVYINSCQSGGMFDKNSGCQPLLDESEAVVIVSAPKGEPSMTFDSATGKIKYYTDPEDWHQGGGLEADGAAALAQPKSTPKKDDKGVAFATYFGTFWLDGMRRTDAFSTTYRAEKENMADRSRPFMSWQQKISRNKNGLRGFSNYAFDPQFFASAGGTAERSASETNVAPFFRWWARPVLDAFQDLGAYACRRVVEERSTTSPGKKQATKKGAVATPALEKKAWEDFVLRMLRQHSATLEAGDGASAGNADDKSWLEKWRGNVAKDDNKPALLLSKISASALSDAGRPSEWSLPREMLRRIDTVRRVAGVTDDDDSLGMQNDAGGARVDRLAAIYKAKWSQVLDGDFRSAAFDRLRERCVGLVKDAGGDAGGDEDEGDAAAVDAEKVCACIGYTASTGAGHAAAYGDASEGRGFTYPPRDQKKWAVYAPEAQKAVLKPLTLTVEVLSASGLVPIDAAALVEKENEGTWFSWNKKKVDPASALPITASVSVTYVRGLLTPVDAARDIKKQDKFTTTVSAADRAGAVVWGGGSANTFVVDYVSSLGGAKEERKKATRNPDTLIVKVTDQRSGKLLGAVSMGVGALVGRSEVQSDKGEEMSLPLHIGFGGLDEDTGRLREACNPNLVAGAAKSTDSCAGWHEWLEGPDDLKAQLALAADGTGGGPEHVLHQKLVTGKPNGDGDVATWKLLDGDGASCPEEQVCAPLYTATPRPDLKTPQPLGMLTLRFGLAWTKKVKDTGKEDASDAGAEEADTTVGAPSEDGDGAEKE